MLRIMYLAGWLVLPAGLLMIGAGSAGAQGTPDVRQACTGDAMQFCSDYVPDVPKITACMKRNYRRLSAECRLAMARQHRAYHHRYYKRRRR